LTSFLFGVPRFALSRNFFERMPTFFCLVVEYTFMHGLS
jgi:hypothetical protein